MADPVMVSWPSHIIRRSSDCINQSAGPDALEETLGRLSKKAGVRATMVLDRASGAILKTSGQISSIRKAKASGSSASAVGSFSKEGANNGVSESQGGAEELAAMVWNFVGTAGSLVEELDTEVGCGSVCRWYQRFPG